MKQVFVNGSINDLNASSVEYNGVSFSGLGTGLTWSGTESFRYAVVPTDGTFRNLIVELSGTPGAGNSYAFVLMVNGSPSTLTTTISDSETSDSDQANDVAVSAGDIVSIRVTPTSTPTVQTAKWSFEFEGDTANESIIMGNFSPQTNAIRYGNPSGKTQMFAIGVALEDVMLRPIGDSKTGTFEGIQFEMDAVVDGELVEFKSTRMGVKRMTNDFPIGYYRQLLGYMKMQGVLRAKFTVMFIIPAELITWEVEVTQEELDRNWEWVVGRRDLRNRFVETGEIPQPFTFNEDYECKDCPFKMLCDIEAAKDGN